MKTRRASSLVARFFAHLPCVQWPAGAAVAASVTAPATSASVTTTIRIFMPRRVADRGCRNLAAPLARDHGVADDGPELVAALVERHLRVFERPLVQRRQHDLGLRARHA